MGSGDEQGSLDSEVVLSPEELFQKVTLLRNEISEEHKAVVLLQEKMAHASNVYFWLTIVGAVILLAGTIY